MGIKITASKTFVRLHWLSEDDTICLGWDCIILRECDLCGPVPCWRRGLVFYVCYNYKKMYPHLLQMIFFSVMTFSFLITFSFLFTNVNGRNGFKFAVYLVFVFPGLIFCSW